MLWLDVPSCSLIRQPSNPTLHMLECCYVKRLSVLLSTPFIIVAHNRLPHITLRLREQGLLALSPQRHEQHNDDWGGVEGKGKLLYLLAKLLDGPLKGQHPQERRVLKGSLKQCELVSMSRCPEAMLGKSSLQSGHRVQCCLHICNNETWEI